MMDCAVRLPVPVLKFYMEVAKLANVPTNDVLNVMLAIEVIKERHSQRTGADT